MSIKVVLNTSGVREVLNSEEVKSVIAEMGVAAKNICGEGYELTLNSTPTRARAEVRPMTGEAIHDNYCHNTLLKARSRL